jgi:hypothetical protein
MIESAQDITKVLFNDRKIIRQADIVQLVGAQRNDYLITMAVEPLALAAIALQCVRRIEVFPNRYLVHCHPRQCLFEPPRRLGLPSPDATGRFTHLPP